MTDSLMPANTTPLERSLDLAGADRFAGMNPGADAVSGWKLINPQPSLMPWLVYEYGLGVLSPFVPNLYDLVNEGLRWERARGSHAGINAALGFLGYSAAIVNPPARRSAWADYQLDLDRVRDFETDLARIAGVIHLSEPARSSFRRGMAGYDAPPAEMSWTRLSNASLGDDSGVRIDPAGPKWSFGRHYETDWTLSQAELETLGIWIVGDGTGGLTWADIIQPWADVIGTWTEIGSGGARTRIMAGNLASRPAFVAFYDAGGAMIGARRCRAVRQAVPGSTYNLLGGGWSPDPNGEAVYVEALTGWGDGDGQTAAEAALLFDAAPSNPETPGQLWCAPGEISTPTPAVARHPVSIQFGKTVRERVAMLLRFT